MAFFSTKKGSEETHLLGIAAGIDWNNVYTPIQKHTNIVHILDSARTPIIADAVVTNHFDLPIAIRTADCVQVVLFDPKRSVVGVVHAGWRGSAQGILKKTLAVFMERFSSNPSDILVSIGPSICGTCYEVGPEVADAVSKSTGAGDYVSKRENSIYVDLRAANRLQALSLGVIKDNVWIAEECTFCSADKYHSYRRTKGAPGRQHAVIMLRS